MIDSAKYYVFHIFIVIILSACSSAGEPRDNENATGPDMNYSGSDCISIRTIRDYTPLDGQHLLIHGIGRRAYFVTLMRPTFELRGTSGLRFESRDDQLCPFGGDSIILGSFANDRVSVRSISRLSADQEQELLIRYGRKEPENAEIPAQPDNVNGAEIEELG